MSINNDELESFEAWYEREGHLYTPNDGIKNGLKAAWKAACQPAAATGQTLPISTHTSLGEAVMGKGTAKQRYDNLKVEEDETDPIERLRVFCSLAMNGQDWVDVEPFFDAITAAIGQEPEAFYDGTSKEPDLQWAYDGYSPMPNDVVLYAAPIGDNRAQVEKISTTLAASEGCDRNAVIEECAKAIEPKGTRPCDCETCDCGNTGDMQAVAWWDEARANADRIRTLRQPEGS
jgi:hypothetical protein